jgi:sRNA-binding regulator protein Hfq
MFKKYLVLSLTVLVINLSLSASVFADTKEDKKAKLAAKIKSEISKLGTGKDARIEVKLKDGTKLKGYVSEISADQFVVMNEKTGTPTSVTYPQAKQVKGNNLSTGVKILIGVAIVFAVLLVIGLIGIEP